MGRGLLWVGTLCDDGGHTSPLTTLSFLLTFKSRINTGNREDILNKLAQLFHEGKIESQKGAECRSILMNECEEILWKFRFVKRTRIMNFARAGDLSPMHLQSNYHRQVWRTRHQLLANHGSWHQYTDQSWLMNWYTGQSWLLTLMYWPLRGWPREMMQEVTWAKVSGDWPLAPAVRVTPSSDKPTHLIWLSDNGNWEGRGEWDATRRRQRQSIV